MSVDQNSEAQLMVYKDYIEDKMLVRGLAGAQRSPSKYRTNRDKVGKLSLIQKNRRAYIARFIYYFLKMSLIDQACEVAGEGSVMPRNRSG